MHTVGISASNGLVIRNKCEIFRSRWWSDAIIPRVREGNDPVARSCAREVTTVFHICPRLWRLRQESESAVICVNNLAIVEEVRWNFIWAGWIRIENYMPLSTSGFTHETFEQGISDMDIATPISFTVGVINWQGWWACWVQILRVILISKAWEAILRFTVAIVALRAVFWLCLSMEFRTPHAHLYLISFTASCIKTDTNGIINAAEMMSSMIRCWNEGNNAHWLQFIACEVAELKASARWWDSRVGISV